MTGTEYTQITLSNASLVALSGEDITIKISDGDAKRYLDNLMQGGKPIVFIYDGHFIDPVNYSVPNLTGKLLRNITVTIKKEEVSVIDSTQEQASE